MRQPSDYHYLNTTQTHTHHSQTLTICLRALWYPINNATKQYKIGYKWLSLIPVDILVVFTETAVAVVAVHAKLFL